MKTISCIIPAYNEEKRISIVLDVISAHPQINEIIVVDDCSQDKTLQVLEKYPNVLKIHHPVNKGKSHAISTGIKAASGELLLFIDADLTGLTKENISALVEPVLLGNAEVTISLRNYYFWRLIGIDPLSGERALPKKILENRCDEIESLPPFGLEVFINQLIINYSLRTTIVLWKNVMSPLKSSKYGFLAGVRSDIRMIQDIFSVITITEGFRQIIQLRRQK